MYTVTVCFAMVRLLLCGSNSFIAFGATNVDVSMKNISKRNTRSDIDDELNSTLLWFLRFSAILLCRFVQNIHEFNTLRFEKIHNLVNL